MTDPFEMLHEDHVRIEGLFAQWASAPAGRHRNDIYGQLAQEIKLHTQIEEQLLYPRLARYQATSALTRDALVVHASVEHSMAEAETTPAGSERFDAEVSSMQEHVDRHVREEEQELFPKARTLLTHQQLDDLAEQIQVMKSEAAPFYG